MTTLLTSAVNKEGAAIGSSSALLQAANTLLRGEPLPPQLTRTPRPGEVELLRAGLDQLATKTYERYVRVAAGTNGSPVEKVLAIVRDASIRRTRTGFDLPEPRAHMLRRIEAAIGSGTMRFALPLGGGKAPNLLKTGDGYLPDVSEWTAAEMLGAMSRAVTQASGVPSSVVMLPDAGLHTSDIGTDAAEYRAHVSRLRDDLSALGLAERFVVADTLAHLPESWGAKVGALAADAREAVLRDEEAREKMEAQVESLRYSVSNRVLGWSAERAVRATLALAAPGLVVPEQARADAARIDERTRAVVGRYIGVNHALRVFDVPARVMTDLDGRPQYVRLAVHAKPGEPRPSLVPSNRLSRPGLLPMHGVGVWDAGGRSLAAFFDLEGRMAGMERVVDETGRLLFLAPSTRG